MSVGLERAPGVQAGLIWTDARPPAYAPNVHELYAGDYPLRLALRVLYRRDCFGAGANVVEVSGQRSCGGATSCSRVWFPRRPRLGTNEPEQASRR
jgi:hypothetical protein